MFITCQLGGGLGNMLFAVATTYSLSRKHNLTMLLDLDHHCIGGDAHTHPDQYKDNIFRKIPIRPNFHFENNVWEVKERSYSYTPLEIPPNQNIKISGYFQTEKHFVNYKKEIQDLFSHTTDIMCKIWNNYGSLFQEPTVSVHVRRGDYLNFPERHPYVTDEYYYKALENFPNYRVLVFSDDIQYCKKIFKGPNFHFMENNEDIIDLYLMSMCDHNIIANSTFSWWGAWLNKKDNIVYAPARWFGPAIKFDSKDIRPSNWILL